MRSLTAAAIAKKNAATATPINILKVEFGGAIGTKYYSDRTLAAPVSAEGRVLSWGSLSQEVIEDAGALGDVTISLIDTDLVLLGYLRSQEVQKKPCTIYQWFDGLTWGVDEIILFQGHLKSPTWVEDPPSLSIVIESTQTYYESATIGTEATKDIFPAIRKEDEGKILPLVWGKAERLVPVKVIDAKRTTLAIPMSNSASTTVVTDSRDFVQGQLYDLLIGTEYVRGSFDGGKLTLVQRGRVLSFGWTTANQPNIVTFRATLTPQGPSWIGFKIRFVFPSYSVERQITNFTAPDIYGIDLWATVPAFTYYEIYGEQKAHDAGVEVYEKISSHVWIVNDAPSTSVDFLEMESSVILEGNGLSNKLKDLSQIAKLLESYYTVNLNDATWAGTIGHNVTSISMTFDPRYLPNTPYSGEILATLTGINATNPVDVIVDAGQRFGMATGDFDATTKASVTTLASWITFGFAIAERKGKEFLYDLAFQARISLLWESGKVYFKYLENKTGSSVATIAGERIQDSLEITPQSSEKIYNQVVSEFYERGIRRDIVAEDSTSIAAIGEQKKEISLHAHRFRSTAVAIAAFWLRRWANIYENVRLRTFLTGLEFQRYDWVTINTLGYSSQPAEILAIEHVSGDRENIDKIEIVARVPKFAGCASSCEAYEETGCASTCEQACQTGNENSCGYACETASQAPCSISCVTTCEMECTDYIQTVRPCTSTCETSCRNRCETGATTGSCIGCQATCQVSACEVSCVVACEGGTCQVYCETITQTTCNSHCQVYPQTSACATSCEQGCQTGGCEASACQTGGCEATACQIGCENTSCTACCEIIATVGCGQSCEAGTCRASCTTDIQQGRYCTSSCENTCQASCENGCQSCCQYDGTETSPWSCDSYCQTACMNNCETASQGDVGGIECLTSCVTYCMTAPETGCGTYCTVGCECYCQVTCESSCRTGSCQTDCQCECQTNGPMTACSAGTEACYSSCTSYEETGCATGCQTGCQAYCMTGGCETGCEIYCTTGCQCECQITCESSCRTAACETACECECQSTVEVAFDDSIAYPCATTCVAWFQAGNICATSCEASCVGGREPYSTCATACESGCTISCEGYCETGCISTGCMSGCQSYCMTGGCETGCEIYCTTGCQCECQITCESSCRTAACETACECECQSTVEYDGVSAACKTTCQVTCTTMCRDYCETGCTSTGCQAGCQAYCMTGGCQTGCQLVCTIGCQCECMATCQSNCRSACETACECECQSIKKVNYGSSEETSCATTCMNFGQTFPQCLTSCQAFCTTHCRDYCQTACTSSSCTISCQAFCMTGGCQVGCEMYCTTGCQCDCMATCQSFCRSGCQNACQCACQTAVQV